MFKCGCWSGRWDSNPRLFAWEANTLPLSYARLHLRLYHCLALERVIDVDLPATLQDLGK